MKYSEQDLKLLMKALLDALLFLNSEKILHRDLKPENIILKHYKTEIKMILVQLKLLILDYQ